MGRAGLIAALMGMLVATSAAAERRAIGLHHGWGVFREDRPLRCFAIAAPLRRARRGEGPASAAVLTMPARGVRGQLHFRLSRPKRHGSAVLLRIDGRTFQLMAGGFHAWAPDAGSDAAIRAAMRTGIMMAVESRAEGGAPIRDRYALRGAATAIDAAAVACAGGT